MPNQHISIEFLGADTLREKVDILYGDKKKSIDTLFLFVDTIKSVSRTESTFIIESSFNPFYTE